MTDAGPASLPIALGIPHSFELTTDVAPATTVPFKGAKQG